MRWHECRTSAQVVQCASTASCRCGVPGVHPPLIFSPRIIIPKRTRRALSLMPLNNVCEKRFSVQEVEKFSGKSVVVHFILLLRC